ncbi:hypothetical protein THAOC_17618, partial [Thalassiosira oceanica]
METKGSKKRRLDEGPSAANGGVVTMEDVQRLIDQRVLQAEQATQREQASMRRQVDVLVEDYAALKTQVEDLKLETQDLRRRCAVNARSIQVLKKDVKWTYSAPDIPLSHWQNQGHGDQYIAEMTKLPEVPLAHDDILLPHWSELSDAIQIRGEGDLLTFGLVNVSVNRSVQDMLSQSLHAQDTGVLPREEVCKLYLGGNHIRTNGCSILPDYIASNPPLEVLALDHNHFVDDDLRKISMALKTNNRLKELHLKRNDHTAIGTKWLEVAVRGLRPVQTVSGISFLNPSFESVFDCNHTCRINGDPESVFKELNCSSPLENKLRKLYDQFHMHSLRADLVNELKRSLAGDLISLMPFGILQVPPPGLPQQSQVHRPADEAVSVVKHLPRPPPAGPEPGQHAFAALQNRPFRGRDQVTHFPVVEPPRLADAARQVERAEEHGVHARHRGDLGYRLEAPGALDLDHHEQLLPTPGHVVRVGPVAARP